MSASNNDCEFTGVVESLGAYGDGAVRWGRELVHVPFALPGETVRVQRNGKDAELLQVLEPSPDRIAPICTHFGMCGGCTMQHVAQQAYETWKRQLVLSPLGHIAGGCPVEPIRMFPAASRRRAALTGILTRQNGPWLGYRIRRGHKLVSLEACPVLLPGLSSLLPVLRHEIVRHLPPGKEARFILTQAANGVDLKIDDVQPPAVLAFQDALSQTPVIRLTWNGEAVYTRNIPHVAFGKARISLPPGAFLQAVEAAQTGMAALAAEWMQPLPGKGAIADLFAGLGAFAFPLAELRPVTAFELDAEAVAAIKAAAKAAQGLKPVEAVRRDLFRDPLSPAEINRCTGVVFDPPRAGAQAQAKAIAQSNVERVAAISCNPATFARDAAILQEGGLRLERIVPFDQFRYTAHVELAALFTRQSRSNKKGRK